MGGEIMGGPYLWMGRMEGPVALPATCDGDAPARRADAVWINFRICNPSRLIDELPLSFARRRVPGNHLFPDYVASNSTAHWS